jgi:hypothetical protein
MGHNPKMLEKSQGISVEMGYFFLEICNLFLEIGKSGPYQALGMGPNIGPVRHDEKALTSLES